MTGDVITDWLTAAKQHADTEYAEQVIQACITRRSRELQGEIRPLLDA